MRKPLIDVLNQAPQVAEGARALMGDLRLSQIHEAEHLLARLPEPQEETQPILIPGTIVGATLTPPYPYEGPITYASTGGVYVFTEPDRTNGYMRVGISASQEDDSTGYAEAGLGIFFRPTVANGILTLSANPAFGGEWSTTAFLAGYSTFASLGFLVFRYTLDNHFDGEVVRAMPALWLHQANIYSDSKDIVQSPATPHFAQFNVESDYWYAIFVACHVEVAADGTHGLWGSLADAYLNVSVPYITWTML